MDALTLYKVGATGRTSLAGLTSSGVEFYTGEKDEQTGVITLTPVKIVSGNSRTVAADEDEDQPQS